jgi:hypothetical protein
MLSGRGIEAGSLLALSLAACIASAPEGIQRQTDKGAGGDDAFAAASTGAVGTTGAGAGSLDPHAVLGAEPPHGPFNGGGRVLVKGKGFSTSVRVWFGENEATDVVALDPTRAQVTAPPGEPGAVELSAQNGDDASTRRSLVAGYSYDALYAEPSSGPVSGGTVVTIFGKGTAWKTGVEARVDGKTCAALVVLGATELRCTVPQGTPGSKPVSVTSQGETLSALDAFTYEDSDNGFKGGLSGAPLGGTLKVLAFDNFTGDALAGAHVIVGSDVATGLYQQADAGGVAVFNDAKLTGAATVTIAAKCHSPVTFADVPVDTVTAYLDPALLPECAGDGDPPPTGGKPILQGIVEGELYWGMGSEFQKSGWANVPGPKDGEERVAFVFSATTDPRQAFSVPSATYAVYETSSGGIGYGFDVPLPPGNHTLYAVAGLRTKATGKFAGYAFGALQGVAVAPGAITESVVIEMAATLDQKLTLEASPPAPGPKGPDRLATAVAVEIAQKRYAILPGLQKTPLLPLAAPVAFVGVPPLDGTLTGARYIASAHAATGPSLTAPLSVVGAVAATTTALPVAVDAFVAVPKLVTPVSGGLWDGRHLGVEFGAGLAPDLTVYEIAAAGGAVRWLVAVPKATHALEVPSLAGLSPAAGLPAGPLSIAVYGAHIEKFDYGELRYRHLRPIGMDSYALDYFPSLLGP